MSDEDFPAAHSMDTEWYAVDKEGNVGRFITGEAGAAPNSAWNDRGDALSVEDILRALPSGSGIEYDVDDLVAMPGGPVFDYTWRTRQYESSSFSNLAACHYLLLLLPNEESITALQASAPGIIARLLGRRGAPVTLDRLPNSKHLLGYTDGPFPVSTLQSWIEEGKVLKAWVNHPLSSTRMGIYEYSHGDVFENWIAGPYLRDHVPTNPLKLEQLPEQLRALFESTRFKRRSFARDGAIDPREVGECTSWSESWVGLDGFVHMAEGDDFYEEELT